VTRDAGTDSDHVAVIHGSPDRAEAVARMMRLGGIQVTVVSAVAGAGAALAAVGPDLLVASPTSVDGPPSLENIVTEARQLLRRELPYLAVIGREDDVPPPGADDIIREPVDGRELLLRVRGVLRGRAERRLLHRKLEELNGVSRVSWAFSLAGGAPALFGFLSRHSAELLRAEKGVVLLYDPKARELVAQAPAHGLGPGQVEGLRYPVEEPRRRWNFATNGPLVTAAAAQDPRLVPGLAQALGLRSLLAVPLTRGPQVAGVLCVADRAAGSPFRDEDVTLLQALAAQASVAVENYRLHQELLSANVQLQEVDRLKNEFVAMVAHDFRSPLMAIRGYAELVLEDSDIGADSRQEFMRTIIAQTGDLARLATDTFLITQMEAGRFDHHWEEVELGPFLLDAVTRMQTDHPVTLDVPPGIPRLVTDPDRLRQLLTNLVSNAVKYSPGGGTVTVRGREEQAPGQVLVQVIDHGLGIPADQMGRLFKKFERVRTAAHERISGTGLGLYICRLIVDAHQGRIWADSEPSKGSTFSVLLPLAGATPAPPADASGGAAAGPEETPGQGASAALRGSRSLG
jgi:signal transduction histidine kinase